jgi:hypothetical protein
VDSGELIKKCFEWQIDNMKFGSWTKKLKDELERTGMAYICHNPQESNAKTLLKLITQMCSDI